MKWGQEERSPFYNDWWGSRREVPKGDIEGMMKPWRVQGTVPGGRGATTAALSLTSASPSLVPGEFRPQGSEQIAEEDGGKEGAS